MLGRGAAQPHLLDHEQLLDDDQPLLDDRHDQRAVLLARRRRTSDLDLDRAARNLNRTALGDDGALLDFGLHTDAVGLDERLLEVQHFFRQRDALKLLIDVLQNGSRRL